MLRRWLGVCAPVPQGVEDSSFVSVPTGEYMPNKVEEVRLRMERVLLGVMSLWLPNNSGFATSVAGEGGREESVEAGVMSKVRRGTGRCSCGISMLKILGSTRLVWVMVVLRYSRLPNTDWGEQCI